MGILGAICLHMEVDLIDKKPLTVEVQVCQPQNYLEIKVVHQGLDV